MKGLMVPLLMVMMTGIVIGQQQDSSNQFRVKFDNTSGHTSSRNRSNFGPTTPSADTAGSSQNNKLAPFELSVSDKDLQAIKKNGSVLRSKIAPRDPATGQALPLDVISGITLVHKNNLDREVQLRKMRGENGGNGIIRFGLDRFDLLNLQRNKLSFEFDNASRGKFQVVEFYYRNENSNAGSGSSPDNNTRLSGVAFTPGQGFGSGNQQSNLLPLLPPPGPEALPGGVAFEGPVMPTRNPNFNSGQPSGVAQTPRPGAWNPTTPAPINPTFNNPNQNQAHQQPNRTPGWNIPKQPDSQNQFTGQSDNGFVPPGQSWQAMQQRLERERIARLGQGPTNVQNPNQNPTIAQGWNGNEQLTFEQQVAKRKAELEQQTKIRAYEDFLAKQNQALIERAAQLEQQKKDLDFQRWAQNQNLKTSPTHGVNPDYTHPGGPVPGNDYPSGPVIDTPDRYASNNSNNLPRGGYGLPPDRYASNQNAPLPNRGIKDLAMSVPGVKNASGTNGALNTKNNLNNNRLNNTHSQSAQDKRTEGFIYFMLLCSLGLNVYLGWISRGFYVRYNELADELRETFTATM